MTIIAKLSNGMSVTETFVSPGAAKRAAAQLIREYVGVGVSTLRLTFITAIDVAT